MTEPTKDSSFEPLRNENPSSFLFNELMWLNRYKAGLIPQVYFFSQNNLELCASSFSLSDNALDACSNQITVKLPREKVMSYLEF